MIVLGIDPGPTASGWALLEWLERDSIARVLGCGHEVLDRIITTLRFGFDDAFDVRIEEHSEQVVAIEWPSFCPYGAATDHAKHNGMAKHLVATGLVAGELAGLARGLGLRVVRPSAADVRRALIGNQRATDKQVAAALSYVVELPKRSNAHARDAMAVAIVGARMAEAESRRVA